MCDLERSRERAKFVMSLADFVWVYVCLMASFLNSGAKTVAYMSLLSLPTPDLTESMTVIKSTVVMCRGRASVEIEGAGP